MDITIKILLSFLFIFCSYGKDSKDWFADIMKNNDLSLIEKEEKVKERYIKLAFKFHPDRPNESADEKIFIEMDGQYKKLKKYFGEEKASRKKVFYGNEKTHERKKSQKEKKKSKWNNRKNKTQEKSKYNKIAVDFYEYFKIPRDLSLEHVRDRLILAENMVRQDPAKDIYGNKLGIKGEDLYRYKRNLLRAQEIFSDYQKTIMWLEGRREQNVISQENFEIVMKSLSGNTQRAKAQPSHQSCLWSLLKFMQSIVK